MVHAGAHATSPNQLGKAKQSAQTTKAGMISISDTNYGNTAYDSKKEFIKIKNLTRSNQGALGDSGGLTTAKDSALRSSKGSDSHQLQIKSKLRSNKKGKVDKPKWRRQSDASLIDSEAMQLFEFQLKN